MNKRFLILDCFVDEPACLGVPPFISPYPRYIYGALRDAGTRPEEIEYCTIDLLREREYSLPGGYEHVFMVGGAVVPGKYLGARIGTVAEAERILRENPGTPFAVGGMIRGLIPERYRNAVLLHRDIEKYAHSAAMGTPADAPRSRGEIARWASLGAPVVKSHPGFPHVICEIETSRGCPRESHCSFCVEGLTKPVEYRDEDDIIREMEALLEQGIKRFRIGRQADILQYKPHEEVRINGFPQPSLTGLRRLFTWMKEKRRSGEIWTLNIDNANPGTIASFPDESAEILEIIAGTVTPGDTMALGVESFDQEVVRMNCLKVGPDDAVRAVELINRIGGKRVHGIPVILPGINLVHGLPGESMETFRINYEYLLKIMETGLLLKRINIRKALPYPGTPLAGHHGGMTKKIRNRFEFYRDRIREDVDNFMLRQVYPEGTVLPDVQVLEIHGDYSYGKQIASYSIAMKYPMKLTKGEFHDSMVIGHRERSLMALPLPLNMNAVPGRALELIRGIGKKGASAIILQRPFKGTEEMTAMLKKCCPGVAEEIMKEITGQAPKDPA